jgi:hypothetical protein
MKRIIVVILVLTTILYFVESSESVGLKDYKPSLTMDHSEDKYILNWSPIPYFGYYEVEILNHIPDIGQYSTPIVPAHRIVKYRTFDNFITIDQNFPESAYFRVSAHGLFHHPIGSVFRSFTNDRSKL